MTKHKHEHENEEKLKHCHCEDCECDENEEGCECQDCHCGHDHEHECECDGCDCEDCDCEESHERNHDHECHCGHDHGHDHHHEHECDCDDCECGEDGCECEDCECGEDKASEYLEAFQRSQAEFDNYRKRNELYAIKAKEEGVILAVEKILPVIDSFTAAEKQLSKEEFRGLSLVKEQLKTALKQLGVVKIEAIGEVFDPNLHNAIMVVEDKIKTSQTVLEVLQEGYKLGDKVIRHSVVKISS